MSRTNRKHRAIERRSRNKGPALLSKIADKKVEDEAANIVTALYNAAITRQNVTAAELLVELAESAEYADNPLYAKARSLAMQWSREPQVVALDTSPQLAPTPQQRQLTDGSAPRNTCPDAELDEQNADAPDEPAGAGECPLKPAVDAVVTPCAISGQGTGLTDLEIQDAEYELVSNTTSPSPG